MRLDVFAAAIAVALAAPPAFAHESRGPMSGEHAAPYMPYEDTLPDGYDSTAREAWLADCRHRLSSSRPADSGYGRDECEAYLEDYYARYAHGGFDQPHGPGPGYRYSQGYGYAAPAIAYGYAPAECCMQPAMMAPVRATPHCTETVEYVYEDVPSRPSVRKRYIPRPSKAVPDKRVRVR